jgi:endonuclease/exonuclease/phosphatase family metal-dependent hydrolase
VRKLILVGAALWSLCSAPLTQGSILLLDSFNYPNGPLVTNWIHHSGTVTGELQVLSGRAVLSQTNSEDVSATLSGQPYPPGTNVFLYASFTVNFASLPTGAGGYFAHFKDGGTSVFRDKIFATTNGAAPGSYRIGIANVSNAPTALISSNLALNTDYLVVTRYVVSNAVSTLWLNPTSESDPSVSANDPIAPATIVTFALRESLATGDGMGTLFLDNLRVATTFIEVVNASGPPVIVSAPQSQTVTESSNVVLSILATGAQPIAYQWTFFGTNLPGANLSSLSLNAITTNQAGPYSVLVSNVAGFTNSPTANLQVTPLGVPPGITLQPQSRIASEGSNVDFTVTATGTAPLSYQWLFYGTNMPGETNSSLNLLAITTNQAGPYSVVISNVAGFTNSQVADLTVLPAGMDTSALSYLTYNVKGNGASDWSTNAAQVRAIGRQVMYLQPDVITFNEIPLQFTYEMTNFIAAFLPGYYLASNSGSDGFIRSVVVSRFPILFSKSNLSGSDLNPFGYTNSNFTRDLFEAAISVPGFPQPLHVFAAHLKSGQGTDDSNKRAAEASAISNFFVNAFFATNALRPYILSGDLNEDINDPPASNPQSIQRLANASTGLKLTTPINPISGSALTFSIQAIGGLTRRYDYIMPNGLLFSNVTSSQVFRTDLLTNPPPPLLTNDDRTASDHLPVLMVFANPYAKPFRLTSITRNSLGTLTLKWDSVPGQPYVVEASSNLASWTPFSGSLMATGGSVTFTTNSGTSISFFRVRRSP